MTAPLLEARGLSCSFARARGPLQRRTETKALDDVSLGVDHGEALAVVGESGSGKSTLARALAGVQRPSRGQLLFDGELLDERRCQQEPYRRAVQLVFQDPHAALNPRRSVEAALSLPRRSFFVREAASETARLVAHTLVRVGLDPSFAERFPHQLSGGQAQRIGLARALIVEPRLLVLDEALSALDLATQQAMIDLLQELRASLDLAYLFITHDLPLARELCQRALVMQRGRIVESGPAHELLMAPRHPYTQELVSAVPRLGRCPGGAEA